MEYNKQYIGIQLHCKTMLISIVVQCIDYDKHSFAMHWDSIAFDDAIHWDCIAYH